MIDYANCELERNCKKDAVEAVRLMKKELRATKHALWMARALRAEEKARCIWARYEVWLAFPHKKTLSQYDKWKWVERQCRKKAKEYR